jgi:hypothetical protein
MYSYSGSSVDFFSNQNTCGNTKHTINTAKKKLWSNFCSTLNQSTSIHELWSTAKKFKSYVNQIALSDNLNSYFPSFYNKVFPPNVPSRQEFCSRLIPIPDNFDSSSHFLTAPFSLKDLSCAIFSHSSIASGLDGISVIVLQNISNNTTSCLLRILND